MRRQDRRPFLPGSFSARRLVRIRSSVDGRRTLFAGRYRGELARELLGLGLEFEEVGKLGVHGYYFILISQLVGVIRYRVWLRVPAFAVDCGVETDAGRVDRVADVER